jgi:adenosylmethionine-8-amino-7-oxononanoate aminotransferase
MGAGYMPLAAVFCTQRVYDAIDAGSRLFDHGHTWDGAPLSMAVGLAVLDEIERQGLVERVRDRGPALLEDLRGALADSAIAGEVRGRGFLLGVSLVDPRDGESLLPHELDAGSLADDVAFEHGVLVTSTHSTPDGFTGDEVLMAPAFTATDDELGQMVERFAGALAAVEDTVRERLGSAAPVGG